MCRILCSLGLAVGATFLPSAVWTKTAGAETTGPGAQSPAESKSGQKTDLYAPVERAPAPTADHQPADPGRREVFSDLELNLGGRLEANLHYRVQNKSTGPQYDRVAQPVGISRYETTFNFRLEAATGGVVGIADVDVDLLGYGDQRTSEFAQLLRWEESFPVRLEVNAAFLEATDLLLEGLDLRLGQQVVKFGVGDQFNPSDTVNPEDLENVLLFGKQLANFMLRLDYGFFATWSLTAVAVPVFRPAILPRSAPAGVSAVDRLPFVDEKTRFLLHSERDFARDLLGYTTRVAELKVRRPGFNVENMQWLLRLGGELFGQDIGLSYYWGRTDMPQTISNHSTLVDQEHCYGLFDNPCYEGWLETHVTVAYPRVQVIGLNLSGELPLTIGYRVEAGLYVPGPRRAKLTNDQLAWLAEAGEYDYITPDGGRPLTVEGTPFAKWVIGLDYTIGRHFYLNGMWVHGFADEFGAGDFFHPGSSVRAGGVDPSLTVDEIAERCVLRSLYHPEKDAPRADGQRCAWEIQRSRLGDYLVLGVDFKFNQGAGLVRLFAIFDLTGYVRRFWDPESEALASQHWSFFSEEGFSAVIYPQFNYNFSRGLELGAGALFQLGRNYTKFGDPAAGGSLVFVQGRYTF